MPQQVRRRAGRSHCRWAGPGAGRGLRRLLPTALPSRFLVAAPVAKNKTHVIFDIYSSNICQYTNSCSETHCSTWRSRAASLSSKMTWEHTGIIKIWMRKQEILPHTLPPFGAVF